MRAAACRKSASGAQWPRPSGASEKYRCSSSQGFLLYARISTPRCRKYRQGGHPRQGSNAVLAVVSWPTLWSLGLIHFLFCLRPPGDSTPTPEPARTARYQAPNSAWPSALGSVDIALGVTVGVAPVDVALGVPVRVAYGDPVKVAIAGTVGVNVAVALGEAFGVVLGNGVKVTVGVAVTVEVGVEVACSCGRGRLLLRGLPIQSNGCASSRWSRHW